MSPIPKSPFILVDGSSYLFRAYHALPPLTTSKGQATGAIFGVINMLKKLLTEYAPKQMAVIFDSKEKNFRHALYQPYKANRVIMPDELQSQIAPLHAMIKAMGFPLIVIPGVEADDVIGTLARKAKAKGLFTLISTGDKDFAQLVDDQIVLINTMSNVIYDRDQVIKKFEVPPERMIDYLSLIGDSVDNIPGIPKVGPKTAVKWLETYGSLDNIIAHAKDISGKVGDYLRENISLLPLYQELVTIKTDVTIEDNPEQFDLREPDTSALSTLFTELEFKSWLKEIDKGTNTIIEARTETPEITKMSEISISANPIDYEIILTLSQFEAWLKRLQNANLFSVDTETTSLNYMAAEMVGISFSVKPGQAAYIPLAHDYMGAPEQLPRQWVLEQLRPILEDHQKLKVGHNLKYDIEIFANHNIHLQGVGFDTMLESYVLGSTERHNMDKVAERELQHKTITFEEVAGKGAKQLPFNQVPLEMAGPYAAEDADITLRLHHALWPKLCHLEKQKKVFETIEMPLVSVLARMERTGVLIDAQQLSEQSTELQKRMQALEKEIFALAGQDFNLNSPKQLQEILFTKLGLPIIEKTPTGQPSTSEPTLQELALHFPLPSLILEYRSLSKLKSTYTDKLPEQIQPKTGRVHTSYQQAITATGRLSSTDPNLQNIPIRSQEGRKIRTAFIAPPGYKIIAADYSQIELRIMAHLSQDKGLLQAFTHNEDIHVSTASAVFGVSVEEVSSEQRRRAKAVNFGLMYGMSAFGLAKQLGVDRKEAETMVEQYFACFPSVKAFMEKTRLEASELGYVETVMGRRLYLPDLKSKNMGLKRAAERAAINAPMQGTNADIIKLAMIQLDKWILDNHLDLKMIMQVHDELVFEVKDTLIETVIPVIKSTMENAIPLSVKLQVEVGVGNNWEEAH